MILKRTASEIHEKVDYEPFRTAYTILESKIYVHREPYIAHFCFLFFEYSIN